MNLTNSNSNSKKPALGPGRVGHGKAKLPVHNSGPQRAGHHFVLRNFIAFPTELQGWSELVFLVSTVWNANSGMRSCTWIMALFLWRSYAWVYLKCTWMTDYNIFSNKNWLLRVLGKRHWPHLWMPHHLPLRRRGNTFKLPPSLLLSVPPSTSPPT